MSVKGSALSEWKHMSLFLSIVSFHFLFFFCVGNRKNLHMIVVTYGWNRYLKFLDFDPVEWSATFYPGFVYTRPPSESHRKRQSNFHARTKERIVTHMKSLFHRQLDRRPGQRNKTFFFVTWDPFGRSPYGMEVFCKFSSPFWRSPKPHFFFLTRSSHFRGPRDVVHELCIWNRVAGGVDVLDQTTRVSIYQLLVTNLVKEPDGRQ